MLRPKPIAQALSLFVWLVFGLQGAYAQMGFNKAYLNESSLFASYIHQYNADTLAILSLNRVNQRYVSRVLIDTAGNFLSRDSVDLGKRVLTWGQCIKYHEGYYYAAFEYRPSNLDSAGAHLFKIDRDLNLVQTKRLLRTQDSIINIYNTLEVVDHKIILMGVGIVQPLHRWSQPVLAKLDTNLVEEYRRAYVTFLPNLVLSGHTLRDMTVSEDSNYVFAASAQGSNPKTAILKVNRATGNLIWMKLHNLDKKDYGLVQIEATDSNRFLLLRTSGTELNGDPLGEPWSNRNSISLLDSIGNVINTHYLQENAVSLVGNFVLQELQDGSFWTCTYGRMSQFTSDRNYVISRISREGIPSWTKIITTPWVESPTGYVWDILELDKKIYHLGATFGPRGTTNGTFQDLRLWLVKTDLNGCIIPQSCPQLSNTEEALGLEGAFEVLPNPAMDFLRLRAPAKEVSRYQLFNTFGALVKAGKFTGEYSIPVADLPAGIYFLRLSNEKGLKASHKIQIVKP